MDACGQRKDSHANASSETSTIRPDWPFHVKGGHMGRLTIQIPWQALSRKSAVVTMVRRNAQCRLSA